MNNLNFLQSFRLQYFFSYQTNVNEFRLFDTFLFVIFLVEKARICVLTEFSFKKETWKTHELLWNKLNTKQKLSKHSMSYPKFPLELEQYFEFSFLHFI